jgi:hypothetical protein
MLWRPRCGTFSAAKVAGRPVQWNFSLVLDIKAEAVSL